MDARFRRSAVGCGHPEFVEPIRPERREADPNLRRTTGREVEHVMCGGLRADLCVIHRLARAMNDVVVDPVLDEREAVVEAEETSGIRLVLGKEQLRCL